MPGQFYHILPLFGFIAEISQLHQEIFLLLEIVRIPTKPRVPRLTANWNSGESFNTCRHAERSE